MEPAADDSQLSIASTAFPVDAEMPTRPASSKGALTLKEQNKRLDGLTKENFDLKLKITFLEDIVRTRSDDGVQEMVQHNVQLQTDLAKERQEAHSMRRKIQQLEWTTKQLDALRRAAETRLTARDPDDPVLQADMHEEILYLRQELDRSEDNVTRLRDKVSNQEDEKRKMTDQLRRVVDKHGQDTLSSTKASMEMWQGLLNSEATRREDAERLATDLQEQLNALRLEVAASVADSTQTKPVEAPQNPTKPSSTFPSPPEITRRSSRSRSASRPRSDPEQDIIDVWDEHERAVAQEKLKQRNAELEQHNTELKRDLAAQTSMLTSRNRERERLQQIIEDLKLEQPNGTRSVAGESIFDRSVSRAHTRSQSRMSDHTAVTDVERDTWDKKEGELRDSYAELRVKHQELDRQHKTYLHYVSVIEGDFKEMENELADCHQEIQTLQKERDDTITACQEQDQEYAHLKEEALAEIRALDDEKTELTHKLDETHTKLQTTQSKLQTTIDDYKGLQGELRSITQSVMNLEDLKQHNMRQIQTLEQQVSEGEDENQRLEEKCNQLVSKNRKLEVAQESLHSEVTFLREEQEGDKIKIGELENALSATEQTVLDEQEKFRGLETKMAEERQQREVLENRSKEEVQKILDDLNTENGKTKDEVRKLRRDLSSKEVESGSYKQRLDDLEQSLRDILSQPNGTKQSMLGSIEKLQRELETTLNHLEKVKMDLSDKDRLLRHRDGLLENVSLESRRLSDLLEKERASRKRDLEQFEKSSRGTAQQMRTIANHETKILELESSLTQIKRKGDTLEEHHQAQLHERNNLLLALWNRLSTLCGSDWAQNHSLVDGELPSTEVINKNLLAFNKNVISAVKTIEALIGSFKVRIRSIEKDLWRDYQTLEHNLNIRIHRMDLLENAVDEAQRAMAEEAQRPQLSRTVSSKSVKATEELHKLKNEVKHLKTELKFHKQHPSAMAQQLLHQHNQANPEHVRHQSSGSGKSGASPARQIVSQLLRHHSTPAVEQLEEGGASQRQQILVPTPSTQPSDQRWTHRLKELERRLKAEREARLLDRRGARQRLEQAGAEMEELREELERARAEGEVNESLD